MVLTYVAALLFQACLGTKLPPHVYLLTAVLADSHDVSQHHVDLFPLVPLGSNVEGRVCFHALLEAIQHQRDLA